jgi:hypothetical protein
MPGKRIRQGAAAASFAAALLVAIVVTSSAAEAQTSQTSSAPIKAWADPGSLERAKTPPTDQGSASAKAPDNSKAPSADKAPPAANKVQQKASAPGAAGNSAHAAGVHAKDHKRAHANSPRKASPSQLIGNLPNKKDGYVAPAAEQEFDPFTGYRQPVSAAY